MTEPWNLTPAQRLQFREAHAAAKERAIAQPVWRCEDCGWLWPLGGDPPAEAECDNCGGELTRED